MTPVPYIHANNRKTHCDLGHALTLDNLQPYRARMGMRCCRICYNASKAEQKRRIREGVVPERRDGFCRRGHELTPDNCLPSDLARGKRRCRACKREVAAEYRQRIKAEMAAAPKPALPIAQPTAPGSLNRDELAIERAEYLKRYERKLAEALARCRSLEALQQALRTKGRPRKAQFEEAA